MKLQPGLFSGPKELRSPAYSPVFHPHLALQRLGNVPCRTNTACFGKHRGPSGPAGVISERARRHGRRGGAYGAWTGVEGDKGAAFREEEEEEERALGAAGLRVAAMTVGTKLLGLAREAAFASSFGVGAVAEAFSYSSTLPSLAVVLLGGVNGALHSVLAAVAAKCPASGRRRLLRAVWGRLGPCLAACSALVAAAADPIVRVMAPGLSYEVHSLAVVQLRAMAPSIWLAGRVGLGFGFLSSGGNFWMPAASSAISSLAMLLALAIWMLHASVNHGTMTMASVLVGGALTAGAAMQWVCQLLVEGRGAQGAEQETDEVGEECVLEVLHLLGPAAASIAVMQVGVLTDTYFASFLPGAAAAMSYANLLAMAPAGVLSSALLLPALPAFARLAAPTAPDGALGRAVASAASLSIGLSALLAAWLAALAHSLVCLAFARGSFGPAEAAGTAQLLQAYAAGLLAYLPRDILVRAFYGTGDTATPTAVCVAGIVLNGVLDWACIALLGWGAIGLVGTTAVVHSVSALTLAVLISRRLGFGLRPLAAALAKSVAAGAVAFGAASAAHGAVLEAICRGASPTSVQQMAALSAGSFACLTAFLVAGWVLHFRHVQTALSPVVKAAVRSR